MHEEVPVRPPESSSIKFILAELGDGDNITESTIAQKPGTLKVKASETRNPLDGRLETLKVDIEKGRLQIAECCDRIAVLEINIDFCENMFELLKSQRESREGGIRQEEEYMEKLKKDKNERIARSVLGGLVNLSQVIGVAVGAGLMGSSPSFIAQPVAELATNVVRDTTSIVAIEKHITDRQEQTRLLAKKIEEVASEQEKLKEKLEKEKNELGKRYSKIIYQAM